MGLDMYLNKKTFIGAEYEHRKITGSINLKEDGKPIPINLKRVSYIEERVGYWRKANQIHKWFVENVQDGNDDCDSYDVSKEKFLELLDICKKVKASSKMVDGVIVNGYQYENGVQMPIVQEGKEMANEDLAKILLPTQSWLFLWRPRLRRILYAGY
jgi:hypothetical protein